MTDIIDREQQVKQLKFALISSLVLLIVVSGALLITVQEVQTFKTISSGQYFTAAQCDARSLQGFLPQQEDNSTAVAIPQRPLNITVTFE